MTGIRTLPEDGIIREPGAYRIPMSTYHQQCCDGPSISSSSIRTAILQSAHAFWKTSDMNPNRYPPKDDSDSLILGKAAHALMLGDEEFDREFIYVPADAPRRPTATQVAAFERDGEWSEAAAPGAAFWEEFDARAEGRLLLKADQVQKIQYMAENLSESPEAVDVLTGGLTEISMIWYDEQSGLWIKSRPDCIPDNGADFGDLKTFAPKSKDLILAAQRSCTDYGYALQMALAVEGADRVFGKSATDCALVFIQTSEPYDVVPLHIEEETLYWARELNRRGIDRIAHGLKTGEWPGVSKGFVPYSFPPSMDRLLGEDV